jgi:hypothetical protein
VAERDRRAKVIGASAELQASTELAEAAVKLTASPGALQLRTLQTLAEVATDRNSTLIFPIPIELLNMFKNKADEGSHQELLQPVLADLPKLPEVGPGPEPEAAAGA